MAMSSMLTEEESALAVEGSGADYSPYGGGEGLPFDPEGMTEEEIEAEKTALAEQEIADQTLQEYAPTFFYHQEVREEIEDVLGNKELYPGQHEMVTRMLDYLPHLEDKSDRQKMAWLKKLCAGDEKAEAALLETGAKESFGAFGDKLAWLDKYNQDYTISPFDRSLSFMSTIWHRGYAGRYCSQRWMRQLNRFYGYGQKIPPYQIEEWLKLAGFSKRKGSSPWPQQTRGQRLLSRRKDDLKPMLDEAAFAEVAAMAGKEKIASPQRVSARGAEHEDAYDEASRDLLRQLRDTQDYTRHQINSEHQEIMERLFPEDAVEALSKSIQRRHVHENSILERKDMELTLRAIFEDTLDIKVAPELSETDPVDINIKKLTKLPSGSRRAAIQVKTHLSNDIDGSPEQQPTSLALMSAGTKNSAEEVTKKIRQRLSETDVYMCVDIHTDQRPGTSAPTTHYHINSIKPEVLKQMRKTLKEQSFPSKPSTIEMKGMVDTEEGKLGYCFSVSCGANGAVSINGVPSHCMERVVSINTPAPSSCRAITHSRYKNILAGKDPRYMPKSAPRKRKPRSKAASKKRAPRAKAKA